MSWWNQIYVFSTPPWAIGRPQPAFVDLVRRGEVKPGCVLDVGCGTGDNSIFFAQNGFSVVGIDVATKAIQLSEARAKEQNVSVDFRVGDVLDLENQFPKATFATVIDSGFFHILNNRKRAIYVKQLQHVLHEGGNYFMLCYSDKEPKRGGREVARSLIARWRVLGGPRRIKKREIHQTLSPLFEINYIRETFLALRAQDQVRRAYLTSATRRL